MDGHQWALGDLASQVQPIPGDSTLERFAADIGIEYVTLREYKWVASAYEVVVRTATLSFWHYRVIASRNDRLHWLNQAELNGWSARGMLAAIKESEQPPDNRLDLINDAVEKGFDPIEVINDSIEEYGPFKAGEAKALAVEYDAQIPADNGKLYDSRPNEIIEREVNRMQLTPSGCRFIVHGTPEGPTCRATSLIWEIQVNIELGGAS